MARREEFTGFVRARYPALLRTAVLLTGGRVRGEDLVQEALLRTYAAWARIEATAAAEAYTRTVMLRLLLRDRRRRWNGEIPSAELADVAAEGHEDRTATVLAVRRALLDLPTDQRAVLVLKYFEQRSEQEIAHLLGCAPGTVKSRSARALAALRDQGLLDDPRDEAGDEAGREPVR
jgi:RNA polymerase sigma-70 factor (sigma-E family)